MIDSWMVRQIQPTLNQFALDWVPKWLRANAVTVMGFLVGLLVLPLLQDGLPFRIDRDFVQPFP